MTLHPPRSVLLISLFSGVSLSVAVFVYKDMDQSTLVQAGDTVSLKCDYQLDTELYSIKVSEYLCRDPSDCYCDLLQWYRDNVEFFRYIPSEEPHTTVFIVPGMELADTSTPTNIILNNVGSQTGGTFKCEVSEGPPRWFRIIVKLRNIGNKFFSFKDSQRQPGQPTLK